MKFFVFLLLFLFLGIVFPGDSFAHPILPPEAMQYLEENPEATNEELETFFQKQYGSTIVDIPK